MKNELKHLAEFESILSSYKISDKLKTELEKIQFILLAAPTSSGRNTIASQLTKLGNYHYVVSDTTRNPRVNDGVKEQNGREYWFKNETEVIEGLKEGKYVEAAIIHDQQVSGISISEIQKVYENRKIAVTDIEIKGTNSYIAAKPDITALFVLPPTMDEWMRRINSRGKMQADELKRRLKSAANELEYAVNSDIFIFVINDQLADAVEDIDRLMRECKADMIVQKEGKKLAISLNQSVKKLLSTLD